MKNFILFTATFVFCFNFFMDSCAQTPSVGSNGYTFTLTDAANTSAGVYNQDSVLVRNLWTLVKYQPGTYNIYWDGKDNDGNTMSAGNYIVKVVSDNLKYNWDGVIGNSSSDKTGSGVHRQFTYSMTNMVINGGTAVFCSGYSEGRPSVASFLTSVPQKKVNVLSANVTTKATTLMCSDGVINYFAGFEPFTPANSWVSGLKVSDNSDVNFSDGIIHQPVHARKEIAISFDNSTNYITGLAVQKVNNYLFVARSGLNKLYVLNKKTGTLVQTLSLNNVGCLAIDGTDRLWAKHDKNIIEQYIVKSDGSIISTGLKIIDVADPGGIAVSPDNMTLAVCDYDTQQVKFFNNLTGLKTGLILGQNGGYSNNAIVANDKFCFKTNVDQGYKTGLNQFTFVCYDRIDNSLWINDPGNNRVQHFSSDLVFKETIQYQPPSYSTNIDNGNISRIFSMMYEFSVDYTTKLSGSTGWSFTRNWGPQITTNYNNQEWFKSVHTFVSAGVTKTFAFLRRNDYPKAFELVELKDNGVLRYTGILKDWFIIDSDGSFIGGTGSIRNDGAPPNTQRFLFQGFDGDGNPSWNSSPEVLADFTNLTVKDPIPTNVWTRDYVTSTNKVAFYQPYTRKVDGKPELGYHIGIMKKGGNRWLALTGKGTSLNYTGEFPDPTYFDVGNDVNNYGGSNLTVNGRLIIVGYHGENWKGSQTNKFNVYLDNGLPLGQFGAVAGEVEGEAPAKMAGNALTLQLVSSSMDNLYLWHGDESWHAGIHRWTISGMSSIKEQEIPIVYPSSVLEPSGSPGVDLLAGLTYGTVLADGKFGWTRSNDEDYTSIGSKYFSAIVGLKSYQLTMPDLAVRYRMDSKSTYFVKRSLENTAKLTFWKLYGKFSWDLHYPNDPNNVGGQYLEILDGDGKIISRLYETYTTPTSGFMRQVIGNDKVLINEKEAKVSLIQSKAQPFSISGVDGKITIMYAGYSQTTSTLVDPTANWSNPTALRIYFFQNGNGSNDKFIDIQALKFINNKTTKNQTINFNYIPFSDNINKANKTVPYKVTLTATTNSQLPIVYTVVSGPATLKDNILTITGIGHVVVEASQAGNEEYNVAKPVRHNFNIGQVNERDAL